MALEDIVVDEIIEGEIAQGSLGTPNDIDFGQELTVFELELLNELITIIIS